MIRLLKAAGVPQRALQLVGEVVEQCRVCRLWATHAGRPKSTLKITMVFNDEVQLDLLFLRATYHWPPDRWLHTLDGGN